MPIYEVSARKRVRFWVDASSLQEAKDAVHDCECIEGYADEDGPWTMEVYPVGRERVPRDLPRFGVCEGLLEPIENCGREEVRDAGGGGAREPAAGSEPHAA